MRKSWRWSQDFLGVLVVDLDRCGARQGRLIPPMPLYLLHALALIVFVFGLWRLGRARWAAKPAPMRGPDDLDDIGRLLAASGLAAAAIVLNAVVCGALSGPFPRYEARLICAYSGARPHGWLRSRGPGADAGSYKLGRNPIFQIGDGRPGDHGSAIMAFHRRPTRRGAYMSKSGVRVTTRQRSIGVAASAAFHIAILIGLAFELDKPIAVESPPMQVTLAPPLTEPPPIPIPIIPPKPKPEPAEKVAPATPTPAAPAKPLQAPVQPAAGGRADAGYERRAEASADRAGQGADAGRPCGPEAPPTPIAHTSPSLIQAPMAPVLLPPSPQAAASAAAPLAPGASAAPGRRGGGIEWTARCVAPWLRLRPSGRREPDPGGTRGLPSHGRPARRSGLHRPAAGLHSSTRARSTRPGAGTRPATAATTIPACTAPRAATASRIKPTPSPDPINDTCPYLRCNMGSVR